ncbi:MAG: hypothetical protein AO395_06840 [Candidatus Fermentibacter daniensis]|nr:MAG: hypothetical protein AO395_06840 [Candidatus Fermentibacter daniensis]
MTSSNRRSAAADSIRPRAHRAFSSPTAGSVSASQSVIAIPCQARSTASPMNEAGSTRVCIATPMSSISMYMSTRVRLPMSETSRVSGDRAPGCAFCSSSSFRTAAVSMDGGWAADMESVIRSSDSKVLTRVRRRLAYSLISTESSKNSARPPGWGLYSESSLTTSPSGPSATPPGSIDARSPPTAGSISDR